MEKLRLVTDLEQIGFKSGVYEVKPHEGDVVVGGMSEGTVSGAPVVMIGLDMEDGSVLVVETTLALFLTAADALKAKYGDPRVSRTI